MDEGIIHAAKMHYRLHLVQQILAIISVGHDTNINILEAIQVFSVVFKTLCAATSVNCCHKAKIAPQDKCKSKTPSESLWRSVMTKKDIPDYMLGSSKILHTFTAESLLKQAVQTKNYEFFYKASMLSLYLFRVGGGMYLTFSRTFFMCFNTTKFHYNNFITHTIPLY
jgi:hypothetical protein